MFDEDRFESQRLQAEQERIILEARARGGKLYPLLIRSLYIYLSINHLVAIVTTTNNNNHIEREIANLRAETDKHVRSMKAQAQVIVAENRAKSLEVSFLPFPLFSLFVASLLR